MLYIFLGPDDFTKKERIRELAEKTGAKVESFFGDDQLPSIDRFMEQDLFSSCKVFVMNQGLGKYGLEEKQIVALADCNNHIIFIEEKLDKRSASNKKLLENKKIVVKDFPLPHGREVDTWIKKRVTELGGKIADGAVELLAKRIGRDEAKETKFGGKVVEVKETFDLWQLDGEIKKLLSLAAGRAIEAADVENLVSANETADTLDIVDAIGAGNKARAAELINRFLDEEAGDDKGQMIRLNALLCDQFRSLAITQDFVLRKLPEQDILEKTGWKSGRLFVMKKIASRLQPKKVMETLKKLEALDEEMKTGSTPPRVLLDLILAQLF